MFFENWARLVRTVLVGVLAYTALLLLLRISGKRTLSKMNAFDLIVTVALGSTLATVLLSQDIALTEGVLDLAHLIFLQLVITWLSVRSEKVSRLVKAEPRLLFHRGEFLWSAMKKERVNKGELLQAMRNQRISSLAEVEVVVLEKTDRQGTTVLSNVSGYEERAAKHEQENRG